MTDGASKWPTYWQHKICTKKGINHGHSTKLYSFNKSVINSQFVAMPKQY